MVETAFLTAIIECFWKLLIILDPFLGLAMFVSITKGMKAKDKVKQASVATGVALGLLLLFLIIGTYLFDMLGVQISSLRVAGGILLLILGIQAVLGIAFAKKTKNKSAAAVIIGTPMLCGPGAITTTIILASTYGKLPVFIAIIAAIVITFIMLYFADKICGVVGDRGVEIVSRVLGLVLAAVAAEMIKNGVIDMIKNFK
jgi:multiple antibiotic resistance protein